VVLGFEHGDREDGTLQPTEGDKDERDGRYRSRSLVRGWLAGVEAIFFP
jgi:hypothetical protein